MTVGYPHVFRPITIGPMTVANRIFLPPHGIPLLVPGPNGTPVPSEDFACYYAERAAGGVGLFGHSLSVLPLPGGLASPADAGAIPAFARVADLVHEHGSRIFGQLHYSSLAAGPWEPHGPQLPILGASATQRHERHDTCHQLTAAELTRLVAMYRQCARHLRLAGYDGVEVHAAHGVLVEHFLSPYFNRRDDGYGGGPAGRLRLLAETLGAVRDGGGDRIAVGARLVCAERLPGGLTSEDMCRVVTALAVDGLVDFVDMDIAVEPHQPELMTTPSLVAPLHLADQVAAVRRSLPARVAVLSAVGRVTSIAQAERLLAEGVLDVVGAARGLIAEPDLVRNARTGQEHRSRTCIGCNYCIAAVQRSGGFGCVVNPATGRERRWSDHTVVAAAHRGSAVVIGGGPAGLEAARVLGLRGHRVVLYERESTVGGQFALWATLPGREVYRTALEWYGRALSGLGVQQRLATTADAEVILAAAPDAVLVATGAAYVGTGESGFAPVELPGWRRDFVYRPEDVLTGAVVLTGTVLVLDEEGINTGVGLAEVLADSGATVHLVTRHPDLMNGLAHDGHSRPLHDRLRELGVRISTHTYPRRIDDHAVVLADLRTMAERTLPVDAVVLATMRRPRSPELAEQLEPLVAQVFVIGDALAPRGLAEATYEAARFARLVGEPGAPRTTGEVLMHPVPARAAVADEIEGGRATR